MSHIHILCISGLGLLYPRDALCLCNNIHMCMSNYNCMSILLCAHVLVYFYMCACVDRPSCGGACVAVCVWGCVCRCVVRSRSRIRQYVRVRFTWYLHIVGYIGNLSQTVPDMVYLPIYINKHEYSSTNTHDQVAHDLCMCLSEYVYNRDL